MKCPNCSSALEVGQASCHQCYASVGYIWSNVSAGRQFVFFNASANQPIVADLTPAGSNEAIEKRLTAPTIVSRHEHAIRVGARGKQPIATPYALYNWREDLPLLDMARLGLVTVVTDRKVYRPKDTVHIFAIGLNHAGQEAELELKLAGQRVYQRRVTLSQAGLCLHRYAGLEEGEYSVHLKLDGAHQVVADCTFSGVEFSLSPLIAILQSHQIDTDRLSVQARVTLLNAAYDGPIQVTLRSRQQVVSRQQSQVSDGVLAIQFTLSGWAAWEALTVEIVTPQGNTATLALPASSMQEREHILISPLEPTVEASLSPFSGEVGIVRGLHYGPARGQDTPFELPEAVAWHGRVMALKSAPLVHLLVFDPLSQTHRRLEFRDVAAGQELLFDVDSPYCVFTLGAFMARGEPYEAWGVVIQPVALQAALDVPETALPGQVLVARVEADRPAQCWLLVYDVRLEHESPLPKLGRRIFTQLQESTGELAAQRLAELSRASPDQWAPQDQDVFYSIRGLSRSAVRSAPMPSVVLSRGVPVEVEEVAPDMVVALMLAPREHFPELAFAELFAVDGAVDQTIRLGDQIGTWRCRAYLFDGLDCVELTRDVEVAQDVFAELDLPAILGDGDSITATARYHTTQPGRLTITTPAEQLVFDVTGDGQVGFPLAVAGEVVTQLTAGDHSDTSRRSVDPPGIEMVTASRVMMLQAGETVSGKRVVLLPSCAPLLQSAIDYLINYPFG